jgi:hypothetical protein
LGLGWGNLGLVGLVNASWFVRAETVFNGFEPCFFLFGVVGRQHVIRTRIIVEGTAEWLVFFDWALPFLIENLDGGSEMVERRGPCCLDWGEVAERFMIKWNHRFVAPTWNPVTSALDDLLRRLRRLGRVFWP